MCFFFLITNTYFESTCICYVYTLIFHSLEGLTFNVHNITYASFTPICFLNTYISYACSDIFRLEYNKFCSGEHTGTHIDAPSHFGPRQWRTHEIPMERLLGPGVIINVKDRVRRNPDYRVSLADVFEYERKYGRIQPGAIVIMNSGWGSRYHDPSRVFNTATPTVRLSFHFPSFHRDAAVWLVRMRNVHALGVDTPSVDYGQTRYLPVHRFPVTKIELFAIENVANIDSVPEHGSDRFTFPVLRLEEGSGGPARVFATYDDELLQSHPAEY